TNVTRVVLGADGSGETGRFKAFWDANYLYLGAEVSPSSLAVPPAGSLWQGEAVEFFLNMSGVPGSGFGAGDFQFIAGYGQPQVFEKDGHSAGVLVASQNQGGGAYTVAVAVPWSTLGVSPGTNATYGFDVAVDMDQNSGGVRTGQLAWTGNSEDYASTAAYGFLRLGLACGAATPTASPSPSATPLRSPTPTPTPSPLPTAQAGCAYYNQQAASQVLGQTDFSGSFANQVAVDNGSEAAGAATLDYPWGVYTDGTVLLAADTTNNRVLLWRHLPSGPDAPADLVIGQPDFASRNPNQGPSYGSFGAPAANTLALPHGVCWDGTHLFIADTGNNRVLVYDGLPTANNAPAAFAIGMSSLTATSQGSVSAGLSQPMDVKSDGAHVVVADNGYNRVLVYNHVPTASGAVPDLALGQTSLSNTGANQGQPTPSASSLNRPYGVALAGGRLLVADGSNNRVLIFNSLPGASGAAADLVVGQAGFSATGVHCGPDNLGGNALGVYSDGTRLFVASSANRVLVYNSFPTRSGAWADEALGQPGPGACMAPAGASATSLWPASLCGVPGGSTLYVADAARNRLLAFQCLNSPPTTTPSPGRSTTPSATATASPTATLTRTASATGTSSPSPTASATPSASRTASAGATASPSPTMTVSPGAGTTVTASPSGTPSPANTATASPSRTATAVNTATASPSRTATAVNTATASPSRTASAMNTATVSPSRTPSPASTATPSASPTPGSGCTAGAPQLLDARGVANGCYQAANSLAYAVPAGSNLLLLRIENGSGALASTASYNGAALTLLRSDTDFSGGSLQTWRLVNPAAGGHSLSIQYSASNCSWNVAVEAYAGVDTATPIGATAFTQNTASCPPTSFSDTLVAQQAGSVVSDFMAIDVLPPGITLGGGQTGFNFSTGCCDNIYGDEKVAMAAGAVGLSYTFSQCKRYSSQLVEVRAACPPGQAPLEAHGLALGLPKTPQGGQPARLAAYPNPAGAAVQVAYRLPQAGAARLVLYSLDGEAVDTVELGERPAGDGQVRLGTGTCASGLYVLALLSDGGGAWQLQASFKMAVLH
ncbi:MAG TPA: sugar-binding protein, partial [bacterium]|nr:sugar-binding protein [bacterium]